MRRPLVPDAIDVALGAERLRLELAFGPLIDDVAELPLDREGVGIRLDEVLMELRPQRLEQIAPVADDREVAQDGMAALQAVV